MDKTCYWAVAARAIVGALAFGFLGLLGVCLVAEFFRYHPPDDGFGPVWTVVAIIVVAGALVGGLAGHCEIRGQLRSAIGGALVGSLMGLAGGFIFGAVASYDGKTIFPPKEGPARLAEGIFVCFPTGIVAGGLVGFALGVMRMRKRSILFPLLPALPDDLKKAAEGGSAWVGEQPLFDPNAKGDA
jgi:MFS family permease